VSVISRELDEVANDSSEAHLALVQGVASLQVSPTQGPKGLSATLRGLLTPITSSKWEHEEQIGFFTKPALETKNTKKKSELVLGHAALLSSLSRYLFGSNNPAGLELQVDPSTLDRLRAAHSRADWVLTLDRNIGLSLYEDLVGDALGGAYVLDYAPDFIDGLGDRLTVTTTRKDELERVISGAMTKLGLKNEGIGAPELLRTLASVSGRLALRLLGDDTSAVEALGLAATISHLSQNGSLKDSVLIPVDAHLDIFGSHARRDEDSAERCDVLLLRFTQTSHSIEFLEVKARSGNIDAKLFKTMAFQVDQTHDLIKNRLFGKEQPRVDSELQWARWCSLLHFYADRAGLHGYIGDAELMEIHSFIDRIEINKESPTVSKSGYIVSVQGKQADVPDSFESLKLHLLNATQFEDMGFTTEFREPSIEIETSLTSMSGEPSASKPDSVPSVQTDESSKRFGAREEGSSYSTPESSAEIVDEVTTTPTDIPEPVLSDPDPLMEEVKPENEPEPQDPATIQAKVVVIQLGEEIM
jgi:DNA phosphorothioation-dependent restriction protein DptH